jgi:hypothetical protein
MTTDVLKVSGDYIVEAANGTVTVDAPLTVINGNLTVLGTSTTVQSTIATISDNMIVLNSGEVGPGVTLGTSGIMIARGNSDDPSVAASFYFDENFNFSSPTGLLLEGIWKFGTTSSLVGRVVELAFVTIPTFVNTLTFFGLYNSNAVLSVQGTTDYENQIIHDDHIPNKKYVDDTLSAGTNLAQKLKVGNSFVEINSPDVLITDPYYGTVDKIFAALSTSSNVVFKLEGNNADIQGIRLNKTAGKIQVTTTATDLILQGAAKTPEYKLTATVSAFTSSNIIYLTTTTNVKIGHSLRNAISTSTEIFKLNTTVIGIVSTQSSIVISSTLTNAISAGGEIIFYYPDTTIVMDSAIRIAQTTPVDEQSGYTSIYTTSTIGGGGTGLYYVNDTNADELVSRRRSIIYGIIF